MDLYCLDKEDIFLLLFFYTVFLCYTALGFQCTYMYNVLFSFNYVLYCTVLYCMFTLLCCIVLCLVVWLFYCLLPDTKVVVDSRIEMLCTANWPSLHIDWGTVKFLSLTTWINWSFESWSELESRSRLQPQAWAGRRGHCQWSGNSVCIKKYLE